MSKLPYGGFELDSEHKADPGWKKLEKIAEHLLRGEALPTFLARWLGDGIERADRDQNELLCRLELKIRPGRPSSRFTKQERWDYGAKVCALEDDGLRPEAALNTVLETFEDPPERSQLQRWRDKYRRDMEEAEAATK